MASKAISGFSEINENTNVKLYAVIGLLASSIAVVAFVVGISFETKANTNGLTEFKADAKEFMKEDREFKKEIRDRLTKIEATKGIN